MCYLVNVSNWLLAPPEWSLSYCLNICHFFGIQITERPPFSVCIWYWSALLIRSIYWILWFLKEGSGSPCGSTSLDWKWSTPKEGQHRGQKPSIFKFWGRDQGYGWDCRWSSFLAFICCHNPVFFYWALVMCKMCGRQVTALCQRAMSCLWAGRHSAWLTPAASLLVSESVVGTRPMVIHAA